MKLLIIGLLIGASAGWFLCFLAAQSRRADEIYDDAENNHFSDN